MKSLNCKNCQVDVKETGLKWSNTKNGWYCRKCTDINDMRHTSDILRHKKHEK